MGTARPADTQDVGFTAEQLEAARSRLLPDVLPGPDDPPLRVLFCGINPGLYTAAVGHHFARPGNRFWPALHLSGFTERRLSPSEESELLARGLGITNVVARATAAAAELAPEEFERGGRLLRAKVKRYRPRFLAVLGVGAYRAAFARPKAGVGRQEEKLEAATVWVLPNPSGLNANYLPEDLARLFRELREAVEREL